MRSYAPFVSMLFLLFSACGGDGPAPRQDVAALPDTPAVDAPGLELPGDPDLVGPDLRDVKPPPDLGGDSLPPPDLADASDAATPCTAADCDDRDPCTVDACRADGTCDHTPKSCQPEDFDPCHAYVCVPETGLCRVDENAYCCPCVGTPGACDDGNPCTEDVCDPTQPELPGCCAYRAFTWGCDDANACTVGDRCAPDPLRTGVCESGESRVCTDADPRTAEWCDPALGCQTAVATPCPNGQSDCPTDASCTRFLCNRDPVDPRCLPLPVAEGPCDDNNACTEGDACVDGTCRGGALLACDDGDPCTRDSCAAETGCTHLSDTNCTSCTTANDCSGMMLGACQEAFCKPDGLCGARTVPDGTTCGDDDPCTDGDRCLAGRCTPRGALDCDDGDDLTIDRCDPAACTGPDAPCCHSAMNACGAPGCETGSDCDDGDECTLDQCLAYLTPSQCVCDPIVPCDCDPDAADGGAAACDDGEACTLDTCRAAAAGSSHRGTCHHEFDIEACCETRCAAPAECDDGDACTLDLCESGCCANPPAGPRCGAACTSDTECSDGDDCTPDRCGEDGRCAPSGAPDPALCACDPGSVETDCAPFDDDTPCTTMTCQSGRCVLVEAQAACSDGDDCTNEDHCVAGECRGTPIVCNDDDPCTEDACFPGDGCRSDRIEPPPPGCERCASAADCDDADPCTVDACAPDQRCRNDARPAPGCVAYECRDAAECDDGNPCTTDTCEGLGAGPTPHACSYVEIPGCVAPNTLACTTIEDCDPAACEADALVAPCRVAPACVATYCSAVGCRFPPTESCPRGDCTPETELADCYDASPCTIDLCDPASLLCVAPSERPSPLPTDNLYRICWECNDTQACPELHGSLDPSCVELRCEPVPLPDPDDLGPLVVPPNPTTGICVADTSLFPDGCQDYDLCTIDRCVPGVGCEHTLRTPDCEICWSNFDCDDGDGCTLDTCELADNPPGLRCTHVAEPGCVPCGTNADCPRPENACLYAGCSRGHCHVLDVVTGHELGTEAPPAAPTVAIPCEVTGCTTTAECDDGDQGTIDACIVRTNPAESGCWRFRTPETCTLDGDCFVPTPCRRGSCVDGTCRNDAVPGCVPPPCSDSTQCDDGDETTGDICVEGFCAYPTLYTECATSVDCQRFIGEGRDACMVPICNWTSECRVVGLPAPVRCWNGPIATAPEDSHPPCTSDADCGRFVRALDAEGNPGETLPCDDAFGFCFSFCLFFGCEDWPCTHGRCNLTTGSCVYFDGDCLGCTANADCEDGDPCTRDTCDAGTCAHAAIEACTPKACKHEVDCATDDLCQIGLCLSEECVYVANPLCE